MPAAQASLPINPAPSRRPPVAEYIPHDPLLTAAEAAVERRQGVSTFWRDVKRGVVPPAIYVTERRPRWRRSEILAGIEARRTAAPKA